MSDRESLGAPSRLAELAGTTAQPGPRSGRSGRGSGAERAPSPSLVDRVTLTTPALDLLTAALLLTSLGVFLVSNLLLATAAALQRSLPSAAVSLGILAFFCAAARLLGNSGWAIVASYGLLLATILGPPAVMSPVDILLFVLGLGYVMRTLRLSRHEFALVLAMATVGTATIVLTPYHYTSFDIISRSHMGYIRLDTLYHASISAMIKNYGVVSTGLNGLVATPYHALSHALFAAISVISASPVVQVYGVAPWVLFAPLLIFAATACCKMEAGHEDTNAAGVWIVVCVLLAFAPAVFGRWGLWDSYFTSESYLVSLALFLLTLPLLWKRSLNWGDYLLLILLTIGISAAKASVGLMLVGLFSLRLLVYRSESSMRDVLALPLMIGLTAVVVFDSAQANSGNVGFGPLHFIEHYSALGRHLLQLHEAVRVGASVSWRTAALAGVAVLGFILVHFGASWTVLVDAVRREGFSVGLRSPNVVYSLGAVGAALAIVCVFRILGGSAYYFTNVAFFVSLPAFAAIAVRVYDSASVLRRVALVCVALVPFLIDVKINREESEWAAANPVSSNALVAALLAAQENAPKEIVLQVDNASAALNPVRDCRARPFVFPAFSERPWVWPVPNNADCSYADYGYQSYRIGSVTHQPAVPVRLPRGGHIADWSAVRAAR